MGQIRALGDDIRSGMFDNDIPDGENIVLTGPDSSIEPNSVIIGGQLLNRLAELHNSDVPVQNAFPTCPKFEDRRGEVRSDSPNVEEVAAQNVAVQRCRCASTVSC